MAIPEKTPSLPLNAQLWYDAILVADLRSLIVHQGTWFSVYHQIVSREQGELQSRLCDYIVFCDVWHKRLKEGTDPDAGEFDCFRDLLNSGLWHLRFSDSSGLRLTEGPLFVDGEASWNHPDCKPTREFAAFETWSRQTKRCT